MNNIHTNLLFIRIIIILIFLFHRGVYYDWISVVIHDACFRRRHDNDDIIIFTVIQSLCVCTVVFFNWLNVTSSTFRTQIVRATIVRTINSSCCVSGKIIATFVCFLFYYTPCRHDNLLTLTFCSAYKSTLELIIII